jgi:RNA polymerase sigma-70 factor (ECF subfamily)
MAKTTRFEIVYKGLALPLTKFVIKRTGGDMKAVDEVVASTMIAGWKGWSTFRHKSSYFTWLCRIALNKISDYYRDQVNRNSKIVVPLISAITDVDTKSLSPEETLALKELKKSVNDCLDLLPPEKRKLLQFRYWYDFSYSKMAKILGISERAVEGKLYRARHEFATLYQKTFRGNTTKA